MIDKEELYKVKNFDINVHKNQKKKIKPNTNEEHNNKYVDQDGNSYEDYLNLKTPFNVFEIDTLKDYERKHKDNFIVSFIKICITILAFSTVGFYIVYLIDNAIIFSLYTVNCDFIVFTELGFFKKLDMTYISNNWIKLTIGTIILTLLFICFNIKNIILSGIKYPIEVKDRVLFGIRKNWVMSPIFVNMAALSLVQIVLSIIISGFITSIYVGDMGCIFYKTPYYKEYIQNQEGLNIIKEKKNEIEALNDDKIANTLIEQNNQIAEQVINIPLFEDSNKPFNKDNSNINNNIDFLKFNKITALTNEELQKDVKSTTVYLQLFILVMLLFPTPSSMLLTVKKIYSGISSAVVAGVNSASESKIKDTLKKDK